LLAAISGGPLGDGRLAAVGPSAWQIGIVAALEIGVSAAVTAGLVNYRLLGPATGLAAGAGARTTAGPARVPTAGGTAAAARTSGPEPMPESAARTPRPARKPEPVRTTSTGSAGRDGDGQDDDGHTIFLDPWAGDPPVSTRRAPAGPSALP
jgi:hypothetical protein